MVSQQILELVSKLKEIPFTTTEIKDGYFGLRNWQAFFAETIHPIKILFEDGHKTITILISTDLNDFVGISTYGQPSLSTVNMVMNIVNEHFSNNGHL